MRLLVTADAVGGVWRYALTLAACWAENGVHTSLAVLGPAPDPAQIREAAAIPALRLLSTGLPLDWTAPDAATSRQTAVSLAGIAAREGVDGVQLHAPALVGDAAWPVPVVTAVHSCLLTWWRTMRPDQELPADFGWRVAESAAGLRHADAAFAPSRSFAAAVTEAYALPAPLPTILNGRLPLPAPSWAAVGRPRAALCAGRFWDEGKDARTLDDAAARLDAPVLAAGSWRGPNGAGFDPAALRSLGSLNEAGLAEAFATVRVFVSAARYEPFGLSVLEAAQAGCALVLSDIPSFRELWDGAARFVPPGDVAGFAREMAAALADPAALAEAARKRAARYRAATMAAETLALHRTLQPAAIRVGGHRAPDGADRRASPTGPFPPGGLSSGHERPGTVPPAP
ncbi:glycosyltransferase family 4 protein [Rhizosaccharibacter radicis]|uniref:Glycosyltransferase family 4 protein n=1 Tax=Rhizosaccharibacter radicis TaxID=2782605 RepID=A0ABT1VZC2_9PROT|nr:glycosyltransferase family 4 protein [Acetobacteraceae bacterium KSS12]